MTLVLQGIKLNDESLSQPLIGRFDERGGTVGRAGHWHEAGEGLVPLRRVFVRDRTGTHREEYFVTVRRSTGLAW